MCGRAYACMHTWRGTCWALNDLTCTARIHASREGSLDPFGGPPANRQPRLSRSRPDVCNHGCTQSTSRPGCCAQSCAAAHSVIVVDLAVRQASIRRPACSCQRERGPREDTGKPAQDSTALVGERQHRACVPCVHWCSRLVLPVAASFLERVAVPACTCRRAHSGLRQALQIAHMASVDGPQTVAHHAWQNGIENCPAQPLGRPIDITCWVYFLLALLY